MLVAKAALAVSTPSPFPLPSLLESSAESENDSPSQSILFTDFGGDGPNTEGDDDDDNAPSLWPREGVMAVIEDLLFPFLIVEGAKAAGKSEGDKGCSENSLGTFSSPIAADAAAIIRAGRERAEVAFTAIFAVVAVAIGRRTRWEGGT